MEDIAQERARLDAEWEKLRVAKEDFKKEVEGADLPDQKLFVGNLDESTTDEEVQAMFEPFGSVKEVYLLKDKEGNSKRSAFVKMLTKGAAEKSIQGISGKVKDKEQEKMIVVRFAAPKPQQQTYGHQSAAAASPYGHMSGYGQTAGYGGYSQPSMYGGYGGGMMGAGAGASMGPPAVSRGPTGSNLYINNVAPSASEEEIRTMFSDFGTVLSIKLFAAQGYGFVSYDNPQSASNAIHALNGLAINGDSQHRLMVSIKKDKPKARFSPY